MILTNEELKEMVIDITQTVGSTPIVVNMVRLPNDPLTDLMNHDIHPITIKNMSGCIFKGDGYNVVAFYDNWNTGFIYGDNADILTKHVGITKAIDCKDNVIDAVEETLSVYPDLSDEDVAIVTAYRHNHKLNEMYVKTVYNHLNG